jgi:hypothetical protein
MVTGPKRTAVRGQKRGTPLASLLEASETRRSAKADAAALDACLAAGKRLRPPPTKFERRTRSAGEAELRRELRANRVSVPGLLWEGEQ